MYSYMSLKWRIECKASRSRFSASAFCFSPYFPLFLSRTYALMQAYSVDRGRAGGESRTHMSAYVSIRQHTSAYVSIPQHTSAESRKLKVLKACISIPQQREPQA